MCVYGETSVQAQTGTPWQSFTMNATVNRQEDGVLVITAKSIRPLWQALETIRRRYGWTVDYEEAVHPPAPITHLADGMAILAGGTFVFRIREPKDDSLQEEHRVLHELVEQFNESSPIAFKVRRISKMRFDIGPASDAFLDTPVKMDEKARSVHEAIDELLPELSWRTGIRSEQGGVIAGGPEPNNVKLKHAEAIPARLLLDEILSHAPLRMIWLMTYEPNDGSTGIGIQPAEQITQPSRSGSVKLFPNTETTNPRK
jgi:hypothetical protein